MRDVLDHARVGGDVLADSAVAAGGGALEHAVAVHQVDGQPVDLQLGEVRPRSLLQPLSELLGGKDVIQAVHALEVRHVGERGGGSGRRANLLGRRVGDGKLRVLGLERLETFKKRVELAVGDHRLPVVVQVAVVAHVVCQLGPFTVQICRNLAHNLPA